MALPKGGGAIRGIGETFAVSPSTGTGTLTVPLACTPGRDAFGPRLALSYDSGAGNGPFGFGWRMDLPSITRRTDRGIPRYQDAEESDVFILSGAEDLVPLLGGDGKPVRKPRTLHGTAYTVHPYRPRVDTLFARIERWVDDATGLAHWRTITRDNVTTLYGFDADSRVYDPADARRTFSWLICRSWDDRGNLVRYHYAAEDGTGVHAAAAHEATRSPAARGAQRYLKRVRYGNAQPYFPDWDAGGAEATLPSTWHFELVMDYGDHRDDAPVPTPDRAWPVRPDPFSTRRPGFELRTYRRCRRVLVFHHFATEPGVGDDCLVRATDLVYSDDLAPADAANPVYTFLQSITQRGYRRDGAGYVQRALPPLELAYAPAELHDTVRTLDDADRRNLPEGIDGARHQWIDLDGEGLSGILSPGPGAWGYKRNMGPLAPASTARLAEREVVAALPSRVELGAGTRLMDLGGDGQLDLVVLDDEAAGFFERTPDRSWAPFRRFDALPRLDWSSPHLRMVDLTGDGLADVLVTEEGAFTFYPSLGEAGYGPGVRVDVGWDEERAPALVLADGTRTVFLADVTGDGLSDLVRVRNGEVCYWPSLGHGRFGPRVTMDGAPRFCDEERFDARRVRLADVDGSGTADVLYVGDDGVRLWFNQSGNAWGAPRTLAVFPSADDPAAVQAIDLLGNGTSCLVWSSPLPGVPAAPLAYVDLMGSRKPHLLAGVRNNLGAETRLTYAPSTRFFLQDQAAGTPWITRLHFPVQVVERVETFDWVGRSRFVTRYAYHHGHYDGVEREFRGFGRVDRWDTEEHRDDTAFPAAANWDAASWSPPVLTRTWFHTGALFGAGAVSRGYAAEYWAEPSMRGDAPAAKAAREALLLPDSTLDDALGPEETRQAYRALRGSALRVEVFAADGTAAAEHPFTVTERSFAVRRAQAMGPNRHAVFTTHPREEVTYAYERVPDDPRVAHQLTLETDAYGNPVRTVSVAYPRRAAHPDASLPPAFDALRAYDQARVHVSATARAYTAPVHEPWEETLFDAYRAPLPAETVRAELTGLAPAAGLFGFGEMDGHWTALWSGAHDAASEEVPACDVDGAGAPAVRRRITEQTLTLYRADDFTALLAPYVAGANAVPGETYRLALPDAMAVRLYGSRVDATILANAGYVRPVGRGGWWIPSGRVYHSAGDGDAAAAELAQARAHFYHPRRAVDPFQAVSRAAWDAYDLLPASSTDAAGNVTAAANDYRVMQPFRVTEPNGNAAEAAFDALGLVAGTAVRGKAGEGDSLAGFDPDPSDADVAAFRADPLAHAAALLGGATTRIVNDVAAYLRTRALPTPDAPAVCSLARESHASELGGGETTRIHPTFAYCDGFGREAQRKVRAEDGPVPGTVGDVSPRWVGSGWTIFDNKGRPVRRFEPFFTATHAFELDRQAGVSAVLFRDPTGRVVATLRPDDAWEKTSFTAWRQETWDANDTSLVADPRTDADVGDCFRRLLGGAPGAFVSWHDRRIGGAFGATPAERAASQDAAQKAAAHAATPVLTHLDPRGRTCLAVADNGVAGGIPQRFCTRTALDAGGQPLAVTEPRGRRAMELLLREPAGGGFVYLSGYDLVGRTLYRNGMDDGWRLALPDAAGNPARSWDARGFAFRTRHDALRRPTHRHVTPPGGAERLAERLVYGERHPDATLNLKGRLFRHYDGAGMASQRRYDFKGNLLESGRALALHQLPAGAPAGALLSPDWAPVDAIADDPALDLAALDAAAAPLLETGELAASTRFDALDRPVQVVTPHAGTILPSVLQPSYNVARLPERIDAWIRRGSAPVAVLDPATADLHPVTGIDYDARGQRTRLSLGNGTVTDYAYDPQTFRLVSLATTRPDPDPDARTVQALAYAYDPVGNVTRIRDDADLHDAVFFRNRRVDPQADYAYDPVYRLVSATGREHLGLTGAALNPAAQTDDGDGIRGGIALRGDGNAVDRYTETYAYDDAGNLLAMVHQVASGGWTRRYACAAPSAVDAAETGDRLTSTSLPGDPDAGPYTATYAYDAHGNLTRMPHLPAMAWDEGNRLRSTTRQVVLAGTPGTTCHTYGAAGERVRSITYRAAADGIAPTRKSERIRLGAFEIHREYAGDGTTVTLERETLRVMDGETCVAMVETRTAGTDPAPAQLTRYQYANHLGSAALELAGDAAVISYEEFFPFGATAFELVRGLTDVPKRYRYTGRERDEESGLYHHGARYYAAWLGRWTACDPAGMADGPNLYAYVRNNPVRMNDPGGTQGHDAQAPTPPQPAYTPPAPLESRIHLMDTTLRLDPSILASARAYEWLHLATLGSGHDPGDADAAPSGNTGQGVAGTGAAGSGPAANGAEEAQPVDPSIANAGWGNSAGGAVPPHHAVYEGTLHGEVGSSPGMYLQHALRFGLLGNSRVTWDAGVMVSGNVSGSTGSAQVIGTTHVGVTDGVGPGLFVQGGATGLGGNGTPSGLLTVMPALTAYSSPRNEFYVNYPVAYAQSGSIMGTPRSDTINPTLLLGYTHWFGTAPSGGDHPDHALTLEAGMGPNSRIGGPESSTRFIGSATYVHNNRFAIGISTAVEAGSGPLVWSLGLNLGFAAAIGPRAR